MSLNAGTRLGRYEIRSKIGAGGMGEVYLAHDTKLDRKLAVKILLPEAAADRRRMQRFSREAKAASALNHPNIVTIYEIETLDTTTFIAAEFIDGQSLRERLTAPLRLAEILEIATQIARALAAAHEAGIIHRDIKPDNIMVRRDGIVKVLDFGLAKLTGSPTESLDTEAPTRISTNTSPGVVMGTAIYMSPEQARGLPVDARTDIFSLGIVIYQMVTAHLPFSGSTTYEIVASILNDREASSLSHFTSEAPQELERIVAKTLRKNPDERYQSAKDLLLDLKTLQERLTFDASMNRSGGVRESAGTTDFHARQTSTRAKERKLLAVLLLVPVLAAIVGASFYFRRATTATSIESIAVLPFINENSDPNTEYLADGIPDSIINSLSPLPNLKVMSRNSAFHYKGNEIDVGQVAAELNVQAVLMGRITQSGDALIIGVELINAQDRTQIWGQKYNRKLADLFAVQDEIATEISEKLRTKFFTTERALTRRATENLKAFQYYAQGRSYYGRRTREDLITTTHYFEKAIAEDQNYALAYAGLADVYGAMGVRGYIEPAQARLKEEEYARKALELDNNLAEAHAAFGLMHVIFAPFNFSVADRELRRAIELSPSLAGAHHFLGHSLMEQGRVDEGLAEYLKARELDPLSAIVARNVATCYYVKREYGRALDYLRQANELGPAFTNPVEIGIYIQNGLLDETLRELEKAKKERPADPVLIYQTGAILAAQGKRAEALEVIQQLEQMSGTSMSQSQFIARIYVILNEKDQAFGWLDRALEVGGLGGIQKVDPLWDPIRSDPRFSDLLRRVGIPP